MLLIVRKKPEVQIKSQGPEITAVMHRSFEIGQLMIAFGRDGDSELTVSGVATMTTPMVPGANSGLDRIAHEALIAAAEEHGFDGEFDIAHRLEEGSLRLYIEPLRAYVRNQHFLSA